MDDADLGDICRVCMVEDSEYQSVFVRDESTGLDIHLAEMIMAYAAVQITVGDGLPEKICVECAGNASKFYLFKKKCEETDRALRSRFGKSPYSSPKWVQETPLPSKEPEIVNTIIIKPELSDYNHQDESDQEELEENTKTIKTNNNQNDEGALRQGLKHEEPEIEIMDASFSGNDDCESESEWDDIHVEKNTTGKVKNFFECDECPKIFTKADLLSQHQHNYHFKVESIKFEEQEVVTEHLVDTIVDVIGKPNIVMLEEEDKDLKSNDSKDGESNEEGKKIHECEICLKKFTKGSHLNRHLKIHEKVKPHTCNLCYKGFARAEQLNNHMNMHSGIKPHLCYICNKGFNQISNLKDHMRTHSGEKPFLCSTCGKGFNQLGNLRQHTIRHSGVKAHLCSICGNGFASKGELCAHLRKHTGARPFVCEICNNGFTTSSSLTKHKRIHSGERPYECDVCKIRFSRSGILARHKRTHTGEKPYVCKYCTKAFSQSNDLSSHLRIHTGEKPFICDVCGQAFRQSSALKTHKKTHIERSKREDLIDSKLAIRPKREISINPKVAISSNTDDLIDSKVGITKVLPKSPGPTAGDYVTFF